MRKPAPFQWNYFLNLVDEDQHGQDRASQNNSDNSENQQPILPRLFGALLSLKPHFHRSALAVLLLVLCLFNFLINRFQTIAQRCVDVDWMKIRLRKKST